MPCERQANHIALHTLETPAERGAASGPLERPALPDGARLAAADAALDDGEQPGGVRAVDPGRRERWAGALRMAGVIMITVTGIVYHALLAGDNDPTGIGLVTDLGLHTVVPVVTVVGWVLVGPHRQFGAHTLALAMMVPLAWLVYALVREAVVGEALYPFMDVGELGGAQVALTLGAITLFALLLGLEESQVGVELVPNGGGFGGGFLGGVTFHDGHAIGIALKIGRASCRERE